MRRRASSRPSLWGRSTSIGRCMAETCGGRRSALFKPTRVYIGMRRLIALLCLLADRPPLAPAQRRQPPAAVQPGRRLHHRRARTSPAIAPGSRAPLAAGLCQAFNDYLATYGVGGVAPTWQLLRTATSGRNAAASRSKFRRPPPGPTSSQTLRYIGDYVVPRIGPVEPVSVYRNPALNVCAGGAPESTHRIMGAVDMVPLRPITARR
jgi:hypothetical protein